MKGERGDLSAPETQVETEVEEFRVGLMTRLKDERRDAQSSDRPRRMVVSVIHSRRNASEYVYLPKIIYILIVGEHSTPPNEPLTIWPRLPRASVMYLLLDVADGAGWWDSDCEGLRVGRQINTNIDE
jgi:hypothetical protein